MKTKQVLILEGSMRTKGNTALLAESFGRGAEAAGHTVTELFLNQLQIHDCLGCAACKSHPGTCVQNDDMTSVYQAMMEADVIVLASPVYFYTWTSLIKRTLDRTFAIEPVLSNKTFYLISTCAADQESYAKTMKDSYEQYVSCFEQNCRSGGILIGCNMRTAGEIEHTDDLQQAYQMGMQL